MTDEPRIDEAPPRWPEGSVRALLPGDLVSAATRKALTERLARPRVETPRFLDRDAFLALRAVCARLIPQPERGEAAIDVAGALDARLAEGRGNGWRYASMPPDGEACRQGLAGIDETAQALFGAKLRDLDPALQDAVLGAVQAGDPPGATWAGMPARRFFEELLVTASEAYYAHPLAQEEIGYAGMADAWGWTRIGLGEREAHEPAPLAPASSPSDARQGSE